MSVSQEIKSQLAKLLATEDLVVEHRQVQTAQFNVHTRVLTLPIWDKASGVVYDLLVGHEVGHALFTPDVDWRVDHKISPSLVNIVEDARIEKLMKRKYPGLSKTFYRGYAELADEDFFSIADEDINEMNLADRVNLWFKIGNYVDVPIQKGKEMEILNMISVAETFEDVLLAAEELYKFCKQEQENQDVPVNGNQGASESKEEGDSVEQTPPSEGGSSDEEPQQQSDEQSEVTSEDSGNDPGETSEEIESKTADSLADNLKDLITEGAEENVYVEIPKLNLDTVVADVHEVYEYTSNWFKTHLEQFNENRESFFDIYDREDKEYAKFKKQAQKEVNYLVKEFECRKAADAYSRSGVSRTGVLDTGKLHTYRYNEDLFKKVTTIADGKNHGLIFVLDWSGSMSKVLQDTVKQLFNLVWFCKKVNIPFEVYAFTNEWQKRTVGNPYLDLPSHYEKKEGLMKVSSEFSMVNILSGRLKGRDLEKQMINVWRIAAYFSGNWGTYYSIPDRLSLSGTPLNESLITLHQIIPQFKKDNSVQKVQCIILTDGESCGLGYHVEIQRRWESEPFLGARQIPSWTGILRDRKLGRTYTFNGIHSGFTKTMLTHLKESFPDTNFIGIRVLEGRDANYFITNNSEDVIESQKIKESYRKNKSFTLKNTGYDAYFGIASSALSSDTDFEVREDATKGQIKSAFIKSLRGKKTNKRVLSEFISLVA